MKVFTLLAGSCLLISLATARVADQGPEEDHPSGAFEAILGVDPAICVFDDEFVEAFDLASDKERKQLFKRASALELIQFLEYKHEKLTDHHNSAQEAYGQRYGSRTLVVISNQTDTDVKVHENAIIFKSGQAFEDFALVVKDQIQSVKLDFLLLGSRYELENTLLFIRNNLMGTLKSLQLRGVFGNEIELLKDFRFTNVEKLTFHATFLYHTEFDMKATFPAVTSLSATYTEFGSRDWVQKYFTEITELQVHIDDHQFFKEEDVLDILQKNRNITSLSIVSCTEELLRSINQNHANIKNLGIIATPFHFKPNQAVVEMDHVEKFMYEDLIDFKFTEFIKFKKLEELQWHSIEKPEYLLLDTLKNHANQIVSLEIEDAVITNDHLDKIGNLEKLKRISFGFDPEKTTTEMTVDGLFKFINANQNIDEVRLVRAKRLFYEALYEKLEGDDNLSKWSITPQPHFQDEANIHLVKPGTTENWVDNLKFLRNKFY